VKTKQKPNLITQWHIKTSKTFHNESKLELYQEIDILFTKFHRRRKIQKLSKTC